jgi:ectoine hydroxylase-related dioxygenase (phytanoyl-CoA dioxygenase family)
VIALDAWRGSPVFRELLEPLGAVARRLLDVDSVVAFQDLVIDKPTEGPAQTLPWHQDAAYLPLDRDDGLVAWVALDDADAERGCLRYAVGSHGAGARAAARFDGSGEAPSPGDHPVAVAECGAGEALFHSPLVLHCSPPNRGSGSRRAWSVWFVHPDTRWAPDRAQHPYLLELTPTAGDPLPPDRFPRLGM